MGSASQNRDIVTRGMLVSVQSSILTKEASSKDLTGEMRTPGKFGVMDKSRCDNQEEGSTGENQGVASCPLVSADLWRLCS